MRGISNMGRPHVTSDANCPGALWQQQIKTYGDASESGGVDDLVLRGKWCIDGCGSLQEVIDKLRRDAAGYEALRDDGWELTGPVEDDYGFMRRRDRTAVSEGAREGRM